MFITPDDIKLKLKQIVSEMTRTQGFGNFVFIKKENNEFAFNYRDVEIISGYNTENEFEYTCKNIIEHIYWDIEVVKQYYVLQKKNEEYEKKKEKRNNKLLKKYKAL